MSIKIDATRFLRKFTLDVRLNTFLTIHFLDLKNQHLLITRCEPTFDSENIRKRCEICSKLTIKTPGVFIVNFEHI